MHFNYSFTLGHAVNNIPFMSSFILSWNYVSQNQYSDSSIWPTIDTTLKCNFTYVCHIRGMSPFHVFTVILTEMYMLQPFHCIAKIVSEAHRLKILLKDKCGISLAKDTSADTVFCFVTVRYSKNP